MWIKDSRRTPRLGWPTRRESESCEADGWTCTISPVSQHGRATRAACGLSLHLFCKPMLEQPNSTGRLREATFRCLLEANDFFISAQDSIFECLAYAYMPGRSLPPFHDFQSFWEGPKSQHGKRKNEAPGHNGQTHPNPSQTQPSKHGPPTSNPLQSLLQMVKPNQTRPNLLKSHPPSKWSNPPTLARSPFRTTLFRSCSAPLHT